MKADIDIVSFFDGVFTDWDHPISSTQTWDLGLIREALQRRHGAMLDVGCGTGRLAVGLSDVYTTYVGVDSATRPIEIFPKLVPPDIRARCTLIHGDILELDTRDLPHFDTAVLASVTINAFASETAAMRLFDTVFGRNPQARILLGAYADGVIPRFRRFDRVVDVTTFDDAAGHTRLLWRGMHYDQHRHLILHNLFTEDRSRDAHGILGTHVERPWAAGELAVLARDKGFKVADLGAMFVDDGGARDWEVRLLEISAY